MHHRPKALLQLNCVPLVRHQALSLLSLELDQVVVVVGHEALQLTKAVQDLPLVVVTNPQPQDGQARSLQLGLQALSAEFADVMVVLADLPLLQADDLPPLWQAFEHRPNECLFVQPFDGHRVGNPVVLDHRLVNRWRVAPEPVLGQRWQRQNPQAVHRWLTASPHYFVDLDTPEDLDLVQSRFGVTLEWPLEGT